jgi:NAD(P)-dependent dehydrogenase (short-subunit alcohol dehydrogenase family)
VTCDVTSPESTDALRDAALARFGAVHVVCLNAGIAPMGHLLDFPLDSWHRVFDVNLFGVVHGMQAFAPVLADQGEGHLVFTASAAGISNAHALGAYSASKHAVVGLACTLREELAPNGVGVSVLCPGVLRTNIFEIEEHVAPDDLVEQYRTYVQRAPDPMVAADAVHDAVVADRLFVLPSPEVNGIIRQRIDEMRDAMQSTSSADA